MEDNHSKREQLKAIVLLLIGFIVGFATHAFTVSEESIMPNNQDNANEELVVDADGSKLDESGDTQEATSSDGSKGEQEDKKEVKETPFDATPNNSSNGGYSFSVVDQSAGGVVYVSSLTFPKESWIAIREDNSGSMGNILGAHRYPMGTHTGAVELLRETVPGQTYYAVVYIDDGDKEFDHKKDALLMDSGGNITATIFRTY